MVETGGLEVKSHLQLHGELEASQGYTKPYLKGVGSTPH